MNTLNIVLISILGCIAGVMVIGLLVLRALQVNKAHSYNVMNIHAKKQQIVFFGDSLTDFFDIQEFFDEPTIYNRGIANDTSKDLLNRIENVTALKPSKLFLLIGTNDLGKNIKPQIIMHNIEKIINLVKDSSPECKIYLSSQYPVLRTKKFFSFAQCEFRNNKKLAILNEMEKDFCQKNDYTYIDVWSHLIDSTGNLNSEYTIEGLHLSVFGYEVVARVLEPYIMQ